MKKRVISFLALVTTIIAICAFAVGYFKLEQFRVDVWQSKAVIAQMQPAIIDAQSQAAINRAAAFSIYNNSVLVSLFVLLPYLIIAILFLAWLLKNGVSLYEQLRNINTSNQKTQSDVSTG